jgi:transposase
MSRLQQDIDDLDRMVDGNAAKDEIRSQIRLISRGVAALEAADYERLEQIARFSETNYIRHLTERHDMSVSQLVSAFENAKSIQDLHERLKAISKKNEACQGLLLERMRTRFFDEINRSRTVLGLQPFEPAP